MPETTLMRAAKAGDTLGVRQRIGQAGEKENYGETALMKAAARGHADCIEVLLPKEARLQDNIGWTALMWAAICGRASCIELLLPHEARIQAKSGWTALMWATKYGRTDCVELLLVEAAMQTVKEYTWGATFPPGCTALMVAASLGRTDIVRLLRPYELGLRDVYGHTASWYALNNAWNPATKRAVAQGYPEIVALLGNEEKSRAIRRLQRPTLGFTLLMHAAIIGDLHLARTHILESGRRDEQGMTALMWAACEGHSNVVELLREREGGLVDSSGWTALMHATKYGRLHCMRVLLDELNLATPDGLTAFDIARSTKERCTSDSMRLLRSDCLALLEEHAGIRASLSQMLENSTDDEPEPAVSEHATSVEPEPLVLYNFSTGVRDSVGNSHTLTNLSQKKSDGGLSLLQSQVQSLEDQLLEKSAELEQVRASLSNEQTRITALQTELAAERERLSLSLGENIELRKKLDEHEALQSSASSPQRVDSQGSPRFPYDLLLVSDCIEEIIQQHKADKARYERFEEELGDLEQRIRVVEDGPRIPPVLADFTGYTLEELDEVHESLLQSLSNLLAAHDRMTRAAAQARTEELKGE
ncbi:Ankyrin repeat protein 1 [Giardia muris]|uniref:Ankyrin repeat protein 1 n=1 Tax=Giardia muris TaxID=5742 RepID=A0A4Z1SZL0_GIAMU|nr:Ankyrin repeat protein 1 [Giardia muris]|eukprot:TNJ30185.1 Ankyrin repeat protein 1 [Giardia muris]